MKESVVLLTSRFPILLKSSDLIANGFLIILFKLIQFKLLCRELLIQILFYSRFAFVDFLKFIESRLRLQILSRFQSIFQFSFNKKTRALLFVFNLLFFLRKLFLKHLLCFRFIFLNDLEYLTFSLKYLDIHFFIDKIVLRSILSFDLFKALLLKTDVIKEHLFEDKLPLMEHGFPQIDRLLVMMVL